MGGKISRRSFLKGGVATAATLAATTIPGAAAVSKPDEGTQLATLLDISKCIGCEACVEACKEVNADKYPAPQKPFPKMYPNRVPVEDWSENQEETERLTPYNWLYIQHTTASIDGEEKEITIPRRCMHCVNPPCVKLCPWGAARQLDNGISRIDSDLCLGGLNAEPYACGIFPSARREQAFIWIFCRHLPETECCTNAIAVIAELLKGNCRPALKPAPKTYRPSGRGMK